MRHLKRPTSYLINANGNLLLSFLGFSSLAYPLGLGAKVHDSTARKMLLMVPLA